MSGESATIKNRYNIAERQKDIPEELEKAKEAERVRRNDTDPEFKKLNTEQQDYLLNKDMAKELKKQGQFDEKLTTAVVVGDLNNLNKRTIGAYAEKVMKENPNLVSSEKEMDNFSKHKNLLSEKENLEKDIKEKENSLFSFGLSDQKAKLAEVNNSLSQTKNDFEKVEKNNHELAEKNERSLFK